MQILDEGWYRTITNIHISALFPIHCSSISFGIDTVSECFLALTKDDFRNCEKLTRQLRQLQASLTCASHVAVGGSLDFTEEEEGEERVIKILREEEDPDVNKERRGVWPLRGRATASSRIPQCRVPATVRVTVLYSQSAQIHGQVGGGFFYNNACEG
jgi:hypothetical protein